MASLNTRARLLGTAIKIESTVKTEEDIKKEPMVNTRGVDKSWPKAAKLVHLDRTPCSDVCIANDHYGRQPDFPDDNLTEQQVTPRKDATPMTQELQSKSDDIIQGKEISPQLSAPTFVPEITRAGLSNTTRDVTSANTEENFDGGITLPDLRSKHTDTEPIDLPPDIADEVYPSRSRY